jgi:probable rRNA maturation factor
MAKSGGAIKFLFNGIQFSFSNRRKLKEFIKFMFKSEGKKMGFLTYVFTTDNYLHTLNKKYLKHDYKTDILTFPLNEDGVIQADLYISIHRVKENAKLFHVLFKEELLRVIFHGALHLCGYRDKTPQQQGLMHQAEQRYLDLYKSFT